jgi:hypothetical protein
VVAEIVLQTQAVMLEQAVEVRTANQLQLTQVQAVQAVALTVAHLAHHQAVQA